MMRTRRSGTYLNLCWRIQRRCFYFYSCFTPVYLLKLHFAARLRVWDPVKLLTDVSVRDITDRCGVFSRFDDLGIPEDSRVRHSFLPSFSVASSGKREPTRHSDVKDVLSSKVLAFHLDIHLNSKKNKIIGIDIKVAWELHPIPEMDFIEDRIPSLSDILPTVSVP